MQKSPYLLPGDKIGLVSPGGHINEKHIINAIKTFEEEGYKVITGKNAANKSNYFAGTDKERLFDFQQMLDDKTIKAIVCNRGGYGTVRLIDHLDFTIFEKNPKWICGFSDVTVLHTFLNNNLGFESIHSLMPVNFPENGEETEALDSLFNALKGEPLNYNIAPHPLNRSGNIKGTLIGGNLSVLYGLRGTKYDFNPEGKILVLEDIGEYLYHLDRTLMNFKLSGIFDKISGLVIGAFNEMQNGENLFAATAYEVISTVVEQYKFPVIYNFPSGHIKQNMAMFLGRKVSLDVNENKVTLNYC